MVEAISDQLLHQLFIFLVGDALEGADPDMAVAQPGHGRRPRWRGFVAAHQLLAGFDHRECFRCVDAKCFEHFRRQYLADRSLEGQPAIAAAAPRRCARALRPEVHQPALIVAQLREQESAAIADLVIMGAKLGAVIAQGERRIEVAGERLEFGEM